MDHNTDNIICKLLDTIRYRSGMYIGEPSVRLLFSFINGYIFGAQALCGIIIDDTLYNFNSWIERKYNIQTTIGWAAILIDVAGDDEKAFYLFWQVWDEYLYEMGFRTPNTE